MHLNAQSIMAHWELFFCSRGWGIIVHLWRGHGWVKASRHDQHIFTVSWSSFMWQRCPPLSLRINLTSSNSFSFCKKLRTETVLKKFCYENVVGALAILFNRVLNRQNKTCNVLLVLTEWYKVNSLSTDFCKQYWRTGIMKHKISCKVINLQNGWF